MTPQPDPPDEETRAWSAPLGAVGLGVVITIGLAAWAVAVADPPGRLLVGIAAVAALGLTVTAGVARPRLAAEPDGLALRGLRGRVAWPWTRVDAVRVRRLRRLGLPVAYLEIDTRDDDGTEHLHVLGRLELGTDPTEVAATLQEHRAHAGRLGSTRSSHQRGSHQRESPDRDPDDEHRGHDAGEAEGDGGA